MSGQPLRVLVTGATGYIGGRLVPRLLDQGHIIRCVARNPSRLAGHPWPGVEIVAGNLSNSGDARRALQDIDVAYYLVHSMAGGEEFWERDRHMALAFGEAAAHCGVSRIIYLGGLGDPAHVRSRHLISRQEVGECLSASGVPVIEFRAAVIVGSGSASFEIIRHLAERLPVMITPRWVNTRCQPIGIRSVLAYLTEALDHPNAEGIYEIGGQDILTYREMMLRYARLHGLRRFIVPLPVPLPKLSSLWIDLFTPVPQSIARPLVESMRTEVIVRNDRALRTFKVRPTGYDMAVQRALARLAADDVETTWASSLSSLAQDEPEDALRSFEGMLLDSRRRRVRASPETVFEIICSLGGDEGWPAGNFLWQLRGLMDRAIGGTGMRRGRRRPHELLVGDPVDFWRVEALEPPHLLRLHAEMKLPGRAWLQFEVRPDPEGGSRVEQTAFFEPRGIPGYLYWYTVVPLHRFVFPGLIDAVKRRAEFAEWRRRMQAASERKAEISPHAPPR